MSKKHKPSGKGVKSGVGVRASIAANHLPERRLDLCRTPHKLAWRTRAEAKRAIGQMKGNGKPGHRGRLHPYICDCLRWHVGTAAAKP